MLPAAAAMGLFHFVVFPFGLANSAWLAGWLADWAHIRNKLFLLPPAAQFELHCTGVLAMIHLKARLKALKMFQFSAFFRLFFQHFFRPFSLLFRRVKKKVYFPL